MVTDAYTSASFNNKNAGTAKPVNVSGISISGADAANYTLSNTTATATADITAIAVTVTVTPGQNKTYGAADPVFTYTFSPALISPDVFTGSLSRVAGENSGSYAITQGTLSAGSNYTITFVSNNFTINNNTITITATAGQTKVYGAADPVIAYTFSPGINIT